MPVVLPAETCDEMVRLLTEALHSLNPAEAAAAYGQVFSVLTALESARRDPGTTVRFSG